MYETAVWLIVAVHFAFIAYVVTGGFVALRWRHTMWLHAPAVTWGIATGTMHLDCPLTWMERLARARAEMAPLPSDGFIAHYITGVIYPAGWAAGVELVSFAVVVASWMLYFGRDITRRRQARVATRAACDDES